MPVLMRQTNHTYSQTVRYNEIVAILKLSNDVLDIYICSFLRVETIAWVGNDLYGRLCLHGNASCSRRNGGWRAFLQDLTVLHKVMRS